MNKNIKAYSSLKTIVAILALLLVVGCAAEEEPTATPMPLTPTTLDATGSGSVTSILEAITEEFEAATPGYNLRALPGTGTGGGVEGVMNGTLDLAAMTREPNEDEPIEFFLLGYGAQAIITHPDVGVDALSYEQVKDIFTGQITNWSEVGGPDLSIVLFVRDEPDASARAIREYIVGDAPFAESAQVLTSQNDMQTAVEGTPGAIGVGTWPTIVINGANVTAVNLNGLSPTDPAYEMVSTLGLGYLAEQQSVVQPLLDWLSSETGRTHLQDLALILSE